jgi:oxygen-independent coproporphyrinogen III oxidase
LETIRHLYFHIPFCPKLCPYCCFYVEVGSKNKTQAFLDALLREVESAPFTLKPETIYFGGGTPTALRTEQLDFLLSGLRERLDLSGLREWTLEANPATISSEKARVLRQHGVTRMSLGVQSWEPEMLKVLGRVHSAEQAEQTFITLRETGFPAVSIDLMFSVPGQSHPQWMTTLGKTIALKPDHISCYCLTYEEDTEYFQKLTGGTFRQDDEHDARLFESTMDQLEAAGYRHYEISNYARLGFESQHNRAYWLGSDYLGFGPSAFSTVGLQRWENIRDTATYTARILAGDNAAHFRETLSAEQRAGEIAAFRMRTAEGMHRSELSRWEKSIREFEALGILESSGSHLRLTRRGKLLADSVAEAFV